MLSPKVTCNALTFDNLTLFCRTSSTITPVAPVPVLLNERTPEIFTASFAPSGTAQENCIYIITIKETNDSIDAANGLFKISVFR